ncbi:MAG: phosphoglucosamine mutase [Acidobacteria bacterium RIFCSPLOWO2_12_FULL_67_14]|nr:MAG: phosphoglucosamine mutase [Acidobacteria bacterium RIFCSPLOWO2_02_FULL_67_21]OFW37598.1 MAG: phosphoglucosamine mutase [Acidobacteria bacterium RIFCSPLOWO2_12_FULL_67_14]
MERLFGTDGVRGKAGRPPLDPPTIRRLGAALTRTLRNGARPVRLLSGRDTRESGPWIERELAAGIRSEGGELVSAGIIPTPAIAYLTPRMGFTAGVVISASHNPYDDNGIKVFSGTGKKFTPVLEEQVEAIMADSSWDVPADTRDDSQSYVVPGFSRAGIEQVDYRSEYLAHLAAILGSAEGHRHLRLAVDCANGATTTVAPRLFEQLGFDITCLGCSPDGRNINRECGSTAPALLARTVVGGGYALGIAFDGDGDRAIFVDGAGRVVDGDAVLLMCAKRMQGEGRLTGNAVVATVMSNIGLEIGLKEAGIRLIRCPVGDKYVMEEMIAHGVSLGGEQSGHVIFSEYLFTGDGLATALNVLRTIQVAGRGLDDLASELPRYPQVLLNVRVDRRVDLETIPEVAGVLRSVESRLAGHGRLLVRYSGTEPLLRIMLEGRDEAEIGKWGEEIVAAVKKHVKSQ